MIANADGFSIATVSGRYSKKYQQLTRALNMNFSRNTADKSNSKYEFLYESKLAKPPGLLIKCATFSSKIGGSC